MNNEIDYRAIISSLTNANDLLYYFTYSNLQAFISFFTSILNRVLINPILVFSKNLKDFSINFKEN